VPAAASQFDLAPHCSLSTRGALLFFGSVCLATFGVAGVATFLGYWPVLPFAGAEMLLLGWAQTKRVAAAAQTSNLYTAAAAFGAVWLTHPALPPDLPIWALAAGLGGMLGVWLGSRYLPAKALRFMLAAILVVAGLRLALG
jgi:uncharacterized membrane protein YfcA